MDTMQQNETKEYPKVIIQRNGDDFRIKVEIDYNTIIMAELLTGNPCINFSVEQANTLLKQLHEALLLLDRTIGYELKT